ncbi:protein quaking-B-like [Anneissia japonica]|uniref:protein quaking-B-like n=1 Tax=Anneissia japonica TaxID=1529436 RepID=UPI001425A542|nr:protein quaking-B-like [Anneissia japonica]
MTTMQMPMMPVPPQQPPVCELPKVLTVQQPNMINTTPKTPDETETKLNLPSTPEYLAQLYKDRSSFELFPNMFIHASRLIDEEISRVRKTLLSVNTDVKPLVLPETAGPVEKLQEKLFIPTKTYPEYNFVGRILGPRGLTAKQLERETGCKIMVRGKGSMRDKKKEDQNRGKPNWEHLSEELHVLITVEDSQDRAKVRLKRAVEEIKKLLVPTADGEDELKKRQLAELAIINGTYREGGQKPPQPPTMQQPTIFRQAAPTLQHAATIRPPNHSSMAPPAYITQAQAMYSAGLQRPTLLTNGAIPPTLVTPPPTEGSPSGVTYIPMDGGAYHYAVPIIDYPGVGIDSAIGAAPKMRRAPTIRDHPYQRVLDPRAVTGN